MPEEERPRLVAIIERIALVRGWVEGMAEVDFLNDLMARDASAMSRLVIGETARRLPGEIEASASEGPWAAIVSLRNRIAHGDETVDHRRVRQVLQEDVPQLADAVTRRLQPGHPASTAAVERR